MSNKFSLSAIAHAQALEASLRRKVADLRYEAEAADESKEGRSRLAVSLRKEADECEAKANELKAALTAELFG